MTEMLAGNRACSRNCNGKERSCNGAVSAGCNGALLAAAML